MRKDKLIVITLGGESKSGKTTISEGICRMARDMYDVHTRSYHLGVPINQIASNITGIGFDTQTGFSPAIKSSYIIDGKMTMAQLLQTLGEATVTCRGYEYLSRVASEHIRHEINMIMRSRFGLSVGRFYRHERGSTFLFVIDGVRFPNVEIPVIYNKMSELKDIVTHVISIDCRRDFDVRSDGSLGVGYDDGRSDDSIVENKSCDYSELKFSTEISLHGSYLDPKFEGFDLGSRSQYYRTSASSYEALIEILKNSLLEISTAKLD